MAIDLSLEAQQKERVEKIEKEKKELEKELERNHEQNGKELEQWIDEQHKLQNEKVYSGKVANAMANANVSMTINKNKA